MLFIGLLINECGVMLRNKQIKKPPLLLYDWWGDALIGVLIFLNCVIVVTGAALNINCYLENNVFLLQHLFLETKYKHTVLLLAKTHLINFNEVGV